MALHTPPAAVHEVRGMLATLRPYLHIAHQVGGRVRLKLAAAAFDAPVLRDGGEALRQRLAALPGVRGIGFNALARSCVIEYDPSIIADAAWPDLLGGRDTPEARRLAALLAATSPAHASFLHLEKSS